MATIGGDRRITAFLDLIAASEGTSSSPITKSDGYDIIVSGIDGHHRFDDFSTHPFAGGRPPILVRAARPPQQANTDPDTGFVLTPSKPGVTAIRSTASGRYQIMLETWRELAATFSTCNFSTRRHRTMPRWNCSIQRHADPFSCRANAPKRFSRVTKCGHPSPATNTARADERLTG